MSNILREYFARRLVALYDDFDKPSFDVESYNDRVMQAFLDYASDTPDNINCHKLVEFNNIQNDNNPYLFNYGFKLKDKPISLVKILHSLEQEEIPQSIRDAYPDLTSEEWLSLMRMATMIINAFSPTKRLNHTGE